MNARPKVVMLLTNEFTHDTRVHKQARSLIEWGCDVHVIAVARADLPRRETHDGIEVHRLYRRRAHYVRLLAAVPCWWITPLLRRVISPAPLMSSTPSPASRAAESRTPVNQTAGRSAPPPRRRRISDIAKGTSRLSVFLFGSPAVLRVARAMRRRVRRVPFPTAVRLLAFNVQAARMARSLAPDVIQAHDLNTLLGGVMVKRTDSVPLVYDSHELYLERNIGNGKSRRRSNMLWRPIERMCIGRCDAVLSVAESICRHLERQYRIPRPHLIRNVQPYEPPADRSTILADELGIDRDTPIVLYPGAITINRGLEVMIDSASSLDAAAYVIMGYARNAKYLQSLRDRATDLGVLDRRVFFRDAVPVGDVVRYTASARLGIVPTQNVCLSYFYESSNKIFHCLMAGVPTVMSDHAEKRLLVEEYGIGVLFDETDPVAIAAAVNDTLADAGQWGEMRRRCLDAARRLNWEHEEHRLRTIFSGLLGDRAAPVPPVHIDERPATEVVVKMATPGVVS